MKSDVVMTRQQADEWIAHLENIFSVVRLLDAEDIKKRIDGLETDTPVTPNWKVSEAKYLKYKK